MSDGIKGAVAEAMQDVKEAVVKPTFDQVGQALEQGSQAVQAPTPQQQQQKQQEDQAKMAQVRNTIKFFADMKAGAQKVQQENQQKELARKQQQGQESQQKKQVSQFEQQQRKQALAPDVAAQYGKAENKGKGSG